MFRGSVIAFVAAAALATAVMTAAMADDTQQPTQAQPSGAQMGSADMSDATSQDVDRAFAAVLISHARLERQLSELVAQKATNPQVKDLAQKISSDQEQISKRFQDAAKQAGITVHPDQMLPRDQAVLDFMQQLPVSSLERSYVFHEAGANQTHTLQAQWLANNAQKPQIKQAAQEVAGMLQGRNQTIQQLAQAEVSGGAQPAGGRMPPGGGQ